MSRYPQMIEHKSQAFLRFSIGQQAGNRAASKEIRPRLIRGLIHISNRRRLTFTAKLQMI